MKKLFFSSVFAFVLILGSPLSSSAIEGGESALGENVVTFLRLSSDGKSFSLPMCSGGLIDSRIVVTAKHCISKFNPENANFLNSDWKVSFPGAQLRSPRHFADRD